MSIPAILSARHRAPAAAAVPWWLSGGVSAANAIVVYQPKGAASLAASYSNLANPGTYDAAPGVAPTLTADGWTFDNTTYLTTNFTAPGLTAWAIRFSNAAVDSSGGIFGDISALYTRLSLSPNRGDGSFIWSNGSSATIPGAAISGGVVISAPSLYVNGNYVAFSSGFAWPASGALRIGAVNSWGPQACKIQALAIYNTTLTAPHVLAISTAMAAI